MKILKTYARMFVADLDQSLPLYERLVGRPADIRVRFEEAELAAVGDFLLIAGTAPATARYRDTVGPIIVDDIDDTEKVLAGIGAHTHRFPAPTGEGSYIRHPDGVVVEYLQWNAEMMSRVFGNPPAGAENTAKSNVAGYQ
ncbi:VOC family protein [Mycolicibacterium sp.]|uniref:VOC family protein n=1 Tax=Mycolicibacterium sp. TaxID=2320850 RepID=UPI001A2C952A|nr:VOC family protein [Mycolicibacterium sp.]MBJ7338210.1 VOC family protein [Mycolicibacterium sp.]